MSIPFIDLAAQQKNIRPLIDEAIAKVLDSGQYIMGKPVTELEEKLAEFAGTKYALSCSSGTSALVLCLMAQHITKNDAVFVPSFTFIATAESVLLAGGTPVVVDVEPDTFNMSPADLRLAIEDAKAKGLNPKVVMPVDLFGLMAKYDEINKIAAENNMVVIADSCQSFGASQNGKRAGSMGLMTSTSFFPAKPLGCYGDGGAIFTDSDEMLELVRSFRIHGMGADRYENIRIGINGRLDTIQAAVLLVKMSVFEEELQKRQVVAARYREGIKNATHQVIGEGNFSAFAQYSFLTDKRNELQNHLKEAEIPSMIYYPIPIHRQAAYVSYCDYRKFPVSDMLSEKIISLPMHPYLDEATQDFIISKVNEVIG